MRKFRETKMIMTRNFFATLIELNMKIIRYAISGQIFSFTWMLIRLKTFVSSVLNKRNNTMGHGLYSN